MKLKNLFLNNELGLSLVQALVTIAMLSGLGIMSINISEKQAIQQKRLRATADLENGANIITQAITNSNSCKAVLNTVGLRLRDIAAGADENALAARTQIPVGTPVFNESGKIILGGGVEVNYDDLVIDQIAFGPVINGGGALQPVDLWIGYTRTGAATVGGQGLGGAATQWKKLDNIITVQLTTAGGVDVDTCYANGESIKSGIEKACESIGGTQPPGGGDCTLASTNPNHASSRQYLEDQFDLISTWADGALLRFSAPASGDQTYQADLSGDLVSFPATNRNQGSNPVSLSVAQDIFNNPPTGNPFRCGAGELGFIGTNAGEVRCQPANNMECPSGERFVGFDNNGRRCISILGAQTSCPQNPPHTHKLILNSSGQIEFECTPIILNYQYTCSGGTWSGGTNTCASPSGPCTSGNGTDGQTICCQNWPTTACTIAVVYTQYSCNSSGGGWTPTGTCAGPDSGLCSSGTPNDGDPACCQAPPSTICSPLAEYTCDISGGGGWSSPGLSCSTDSGDCTSTAVVADGAMKCCSGTPNAAKCPSSVTRLYTCNDSTGSWSPGATGCSSPSVDAGYCSSGTALNGDQACCSSAPSGTCPGLTNLTYTCDFSSSRWVAGSSCTTPGGKCTSGTPVDRETACCSSAPTTGCAAGNLTYTCTSGSWVASSSCGATSGKCTSGTANPSETACCSATPSSTCDAGKRQYECVASGGWVDNGACTGTAGNGFCTGSSGPALGFEGACCSAVPRSICAGNPNQTYTCRFSSSRWVSGSTCGGVSGKCTSGTPTDGETACCPGGSPPTTTCAAPPVVNQYRCESSSWRATGSTCGTPLGPCTSGSGIENDVACCTARPTSSCNPAPPTYSRWLCSGGSWTAQSGTCGSASNCTGSRADGTPACCTARPTGTCQPPAPTYSRWLCSGGSWTAQSGTCGSALNCTGTRANGTSACCTARPSGTCQPASPSYTRWQCNDGSWSPASGSCSSASNCSGSQAHLATACCVGSPGGACQRQPVVPAYNNYICSRGSWNLQSTNSCSTLSNCTGARNNGTSACCSSTPSGTCRSGSGGGCSSTYSCTGGSSCIGGCPSSHGCSIQSGNCDRSAPSGSCVAICTTSGNHACYRQEGRTSKDYAGRGCF